MKSQVKRTLAMLLCVLTVFALFPVSADAATAYSTLSSKKVLIEYPTKALSDIMVAKTTGGKKNNGVYLVPKPGTGNGDMGTVKNGSNMILLAEDGEFYFAMTTSGKLGWVNKKYLTEPVEAPSGYLFGSSGLDRDDAEKVRDFILDGSDDRGYASKNFYASRAVLVMKKGETKKISLHRKWVGQYHIYYWASDVSLKWIGRSANCKVQIKAKETGSTTLTFTNDMNSQEFDVMILVT